MDVSLGMLGVGGLGQVGVVGVHRDVRGGGLGAGGVTG